MYYTMLSMIDFYTSDDNMALDLHSIFLAEVTKHFHISHSQMRYRGTAVNFTLQKKK